MPQLTQLGQVSVPNKTSLTTQHFIGEEQNLERQKVSRMDVSELPSMHGIFIFFVLCALRHKHDL
jgi:hypothetical protein